jgi:hypothetical protein
MILVLAPHPSAENHKDGMIQRIAHIDGLMASSQRTYLDISVRRFVRKHVQVEGLVTIYRLNLLVHVFQIARLIKQADLVYIHSAYNALKTCLFPTNAHVVFDAHGIVPEELAQEGQNLAARAFAFAERHALRRCNTLVCVTRSMLLHFKAKYKNRTDREEIVLPILPRLGEAKEVAQAHQATRNDDSVIYAGGMQVWQNVEKMIAAATRQPDYSYTFLSGVPDQFKARLEFSSIRRFYCGSVHPEEVKCYYRKNQFGFILRDRNLVNEVACPTKLIEYLYWGVIPIVIDHQIGDFNTTNLSAVTLEAFESGNLPDQKTLDNMRSSNLASVHAIVRSAQAQLDRLREIVLNCA